MAYLSNPNARLSLLSSGSGPAQSSAPTTTGAQPQPAQPKGSGAFQDLSGYLSANGPAAQAYADKILGGLDTEAAQTAAPVTLDPGVRAGSQAETDANARVTARNAAAQKMAGTLDTYAAPGGLGTFLSDQAPTGTSPYTPGMAAFDAYLLGQSGAGDRLAALKAKWDPLLADQGALKGSEYTGPGRQVRPASSPVLAPVQPSTPAAPAPTPALGQNTGQGFLGNTTIAPGTATPSAPVSGATMNDRWKTPDGSPAGQTWQWSERFGQWVRR